MNNLEYEEEAGDHSAFPREAPSPHTSPFGLYRSIVFTSRPVSINSESSHVVWSSTQHYTQNNSNPFRAFSLGNSIP